jgi:hypothetical protein
MTDFITSFFDSPINSALLRLQTRREIDRIQIEYKVLALISAYSLRDEVRLRRPFPVWQTLTHLIVNAYSMGEHSNPTTIFIAWGAFELAERFVILTHVYGDGSLYHLYRLMMIH